MRPSIAVFLLLFTPEVRRQRRLIKYRNDLNAYYKKTFRLFAALISMSMFSYAQPKSENFRLDLCFYPSFMSAGELIIERKGDVGLLHICVDENHYSKEPSIESEATVPIGEFISLMNFLKAYKFQIRGSADTIGSHKKLVNGDSVVVYDVEYGSDGIDVKGTFRQQNLDKKFKFWSPKDSSENAKFMAIIFALTDKAFNTLRVVNYLEQLEQYFPHHLGLKKLSDMPLTYKLYGSISVSEADEFYDFLDKIPRHTKTIIDMSNFSGMGTMFFDVLDDYGVKKKKVYWLNPTFQALIDLYKMGVPKRRIISKKKLVVTIENGREKYSLKDN